MNRTARRTVTGILAGALAASSLPVVMAGSAQAAAEFITPAQAASALRAASSATVAAYSNTGGRSVGSLKFSVAATGPSFTLTTSLTADAKRRTARRAFTAPSVALEPGSGFRDAPCALEGSTYDPSGEVQIVAERKARYTSLGSPPDQVVRKARKLVKRPKATWDARPTRSTLASTVRSADLGLGAALAATQFATISSATRTDIPAGLRYTVIYTDFIDTRNRLVLDVDAAGRIIASSTVGTDDTITQTTYSTTVYGPQNVLPPAPSSTVPRARLVKGCKAILVRQKVVRTVREARAQLNSFAEAVGRKVTVGEVRRRVARDLRSSEFEVSLNIRDNDIAGGVSVVGRSPLLDRPVKRRLLVVDGRAVVRKG